MNEWRNRWLRWTKLRFAIIYPLGLLAVFIGQCDERSLRAGTILLLLGAALRLWANGYAIKTDKLTTCGPYAIVRNPLYLGSSLIVIGFLILLKLGYVGAVFFCGWVAVYIRTIRREEKALETKFQTAYLEYKRAVPAIIPTIFPYKGKERWDFSLQRVIENKEYKIFFWVIIGIIFFYTKEELSEQKHLMLKQWGLIILAVVLGMIDIAGEIYKWKEKLRYTQRP